MALSDSEIRQINSALAREPEWKRALIEASVDAFCEWLRRVLPGVLSRILDVISDVFWSIFG